MPHQEGDTALDFACSMDIPYFPTLPALGSREGILFQALDGFPGIFWQSDGSPRLERTIGERGAVSPRSSESLWNPFLNRLPRHPSLWAKTQLLGPVTSMLSILGVEGLPSSQAMKLARQVSEWLLAKAMVQVEEVRRAGKRAIFFWDEPALTAPEASLPMAQVAAEGLRQGIVALKKAGATVGIHCCGDWDFAEQLRWPQDIVSLDWELSGAALLKETEKLREFRVRGGRLAMGLVPTQLPSTWNSRQEMEQCRARLAGALGEAEAKALLTESLVAPACGLGLRTMPEAAAVFAALRECQEYLRNDV